MGADVKGKGMGKIKVFLVLFLVFGFMWVMGYGSEVKVGDIEKLRKRSEEWVDKLNGTIREVANGTEDMRKSAEKVYRFKESEEFRERVERYQEYLGKMLGERYGFSYEELKRRGERYSKVKGVIKGDRVILGKDERIYVFVSSGIADVVRRYIEDSVMVIGEVKFVLRGAIGGLTHLRPTAEWVLDMLLVDRACKLFEETCELYDREFLIDPLLFRRYNIKRVPVVVYVKGEGEREEVVVISPGAISFKRHLERIFEVVKKKP